MSLVETWVRESATDIHARLAGVHFEAAESPDESNTTPSSPVQREYSRSQRSFGSSMAPALIHQSAPSAHPPSLRSCYTEATPTETSISTDIVNLFTGVTLLEEHNGVLELPRNLHVHTPMYECAFWFLSCGYISHNREEWLMHCESHFRGEEPPQTVQCPLCEWAVSSDDGRASWQARMMHLATEHTMMGQTLRTSRPDFGLFQHLWRKRLIDDQDLKELNGGNHNLERPPGNYVETNRRGGRRERDAGRRRQHVPGRQPDPRRV
ncbi:hypothetical protein CC86DRAFT_367656 [Ophiobolus disseminans]|uniref:Uncharacterized protein n=1 Tax=Ophiobolus disseminans TaxID=1469910 RepID=A0A6A7A973_9PLEO|nr:hypothetical protein CC86DRAFT_367656 [Ophiobolus disseminans]